ncbi:hypothetical protein GCM10017612_27680 [Novosphingobium resinovorum]|nr:hypothetical protein GCM10017612_27680 [Novosphingobium resinovorum]
MKRPSLAPCRQPGHDFAIERAKGHWHGFVAQLCKHAIQIVQAFAPFTRPHAVGLTAHTRQIAASLAP